MLMAAAPHVAMAAGGMGGAAGATGGKAGSGAGGVAGKGGAGGASGGAAGKSGSGGASGFTQAVKPKDGGALAGTGNKTATYAVTCADDITGRCAKTTGNIVFDKKQTPPGISGYNFNTGWIPDGSVLQVQFGVEIPAVTHVHLETPFIAQWPEAITLTTPGARKTGQLDFDYGIKTIAKVKAEGDIFGIDFKFERDLPGIPQIDFGVSGQRTFDPWVWDGVRAEGSTNPFTLLDINILDFVGLPSQIAKAGLTLVVFGTLGVKYNTDRIVITPSDGPITKDNSSTVHDFQQGAWAEYKFHPEGTVDYDGAITLQPQAYVEVVGKKFAIPIYTYEYPIELPKTPYIFDDQLVHVPLPDIRLPKEGDTIDIGKVTVGEPKLFQIAFPNIGEAPVVATMYVDDPKVFQVLNKTATAEPAKDLVTKLAFYAAEPGPFTAKLLVASNDPDSPYVAVTLKGESEGLPPDPTRPPPPGGNGGSGGSLAIEPPDEEEDGGAGGATPTGGAGGKKTRANAVPNSGDEGGCGCRVTPSNDAPPRAALSLLALTSFLALRRQSRQTSRKSQSVVPPARNTAR